MAPAREDLLVAIDHALVARDMAAVAGLVRVLAVHYPDDARAILDAVELAGAR